MSDPTQRPDPPDAEDPAEGAPPPDSGDRSGAAAVDPSEDLDDHTGEGEDAPTSQPEDDLEVTVVESSVDPADPVAHPDAADDVVVESSLDPITPAADPIAESVDPAAGAPIAAMPGPTTASSTGVRRAGLVVLVLLAILVVVLVVPSLLPGTSDPAFVVYDEPTTRDELRDRLDGLVDDELVDSIGRDDATPDQQAELAGIMSVLITLDVLEGAAEAEGVEVTDADVDAQLDEVLQTAFGGDQTAFDSQLEATGLTEDLVRLQFRTALLAERLVEGQVDPLDPDLVRQAYEQEFAQPSVAHILVETEEEATAALARLDDGEPFADLAQELSIDPGSGAQGGQLGPLQPGVFVPEFEDAALELSPGEISDPVETQFGFHLITVDEPAPFEEVEAELTRALEEQQLGEAFAELAERLDAEAQVTVDPEFGVWQGLVSGGLQPPIAEGQQEEPFDLPLDDG